ncbi:hypothetical protein HDU93_001488, partial [Gonapodya sp. JEL0774]
MATLILFVVLLSATWGCSAPASAMKIVPGLSTWTSCGSHLDCAKLTVPLEYADSASSDVAIIPLVRYNATAPTGRKGSLLVNPGGPGASGVGFVTAGTGASISTVTGGEYDIVGFDPRGAGGAEPRLVCFASAGEEYDFNAAFPAGVDSWIGAFSNSTETKMVANSLEAFDNASRLLAQECLKQNSTALFTSTAAYVVRDMASIVDMLDGPGAKLNYWGFSYGTIYGVEFIQTFPQRVGRVVMDGVFDAEANAQTYASQLPNDQVSVRSAISDFAEFCFTAGPTACNFAGISTSAEDIERRFDELHKVAFENPVTASGVPITASVLSSFLWSFFTVPPTWPVVASLIAALEIGDAGPLLEVLVQSAGSAPSNRSAPATGTVSVMPFVLNCLDNAPTNLLPLSYIRDLVRLITVTENTPWIGADLGTISFCRNFPSRRPKLSNLGVSKIAETDKALSKQNTTILIVNGAHDSTTPLASAKHLRSLLPSSSRIATRKGPGHTTISVPSLGLAKAVAMYFTTGKVALDN